MCIVSCTCGTALVLDAEFCFQPRSNKTVIIIGHTVGGLSLYLIGPAPFLPIP